LVHGADKGWGLSFFCELLGASLIGASTIANKDVPKTTKRVNSMMAIIIDPSLAQTDGPGGGLAAEIDDLVAYAKASGELFRSVA
jgi:LDH2 family malate/lactate/ureidoglycolate dehydrogenase